MCSLSGFQGGATAVIQAVRARGRGECPGICVLVFRYLLSTSVLVFRYTLSTHSDLVPLCTLNAKRETLNPILYVVYAQCPCVQVYVVYAQCPSAFVYPKR